MVDINPERENRINKLNKLREAGVEVYPAKFDKQNKLSEISISKEGTKIKTAGRIMTFRDMGKIAFCHLQDDSAKAQIVFKKDILGDDAYKQLVKLTDLGDFIGVEGDVFTTQKGEISVLASNWTFLGKALLPLPEKFHGLKDEEAIYRQRYLDIISNEDAKERFILRSKFLKAIREFYWKEGFMEVETPVLNQKATGASAKPYITHNNALDLDLVLRISPELALKEIIVAGYEKIFELGKAFRNEGQDPSHLPEHTHVEHYSAYWDFNDNIEFTEKMFNYIFDELNIERKMKIKDKDGNESDVDWSTPWKKINYIEMVSKDSGIDIMSYTDADKLRIDIKKNGIEFEGMDAMGLSTLIDNIYKKVSRPKIINPTILYNYPKIVQPLARTNDENNNTVDQFQLVVNGWEIVKAYSELVDPIDQKERFIEQSKAKKAGDEEAMEVDEEYITAMEHGMPPISGWGMGIDRFLALVTGQDNLRDVIFFPLMRPSDDSTDLQIKR